MKSIKLKHKHCGRCGELKKINKFSLNKNKPDGRNSFCKSCNKEYQKEWYKKNKKRHIRTCIKNRKKDRKYYSDFIKSLKSECIVCGEDRKVCLDFHHIDEDDKEFNIGDALNLGFGKLVILKEVKKCVVVCANCHRLIHAEEINLENYID